MIFCDSITGQKLIWQDVLDRMRTAHPNRLVSLNPETVTEQQLDPYSVSIVQPAAPPAAPACCEVVEGGYDQIEGVWTQTWEVIYPSLADAQAFAHARLNRDFDASLPPVDYDGKTWRPGHSSAAVIRDAAEMAELLGLTEVTLTDINDNEHVYTLANARLVGASIGVAYQQVFLARGAKRRAIDNAGSPQAALAITWNGGQT